MSDFKPVLFLNGPNLNMLGTRQPEIYGYSTLQDVKNAAEAKAKGLGLTIDFRQSNSEAELIGWVQQARDKFSGIIINPAAFTHTSVALMDSLFIFNGPILELHVGNNFKREEFRHKSFVSNAATAIMEGFGPDGYEIAVFGMFKLLKKASAAKAA
jgi:3-dehydroquinate dehydratase-2